MKISLNVNKSNVNKNGEAPLYFRVSLDNEAKERFRISLNMSAPPGKINGFEVRGVSDADNINLVISRNKGILSEILTNLKFENRLTRENVIRLYDERANNKTPTENKPKIKALDLKAIREIHKEKYKNRFSANYLRSFETLEYNLKEFTERESILPVEIDQDFIDSFIDWFIENERVNNTIATNVKRLIALLKFAAVKGCQISDISEVSISYDADNPFFLEWNEILKIDQFEGKLLKPIQLIVKDEFVLRAFLGIREGDVKHINKNSFEKTKEGYQLVFSMGKVRRTHKIATPKRAYEIMEKYDFNIPFMTQQTKNREIKNVAEAASISGKVEKIRYAGNKTITKTFERHKMISTHSARRSFAKHWIDQGGDIVLLSKYLGHRNVNTTLNYVGYSNEEAGKMMRKIFD